MSGHNTTIPPSMTASAPDTSIGFDKSSNFAGGASRASPTAGSRGRRSIRRWWGGEGTGVDYFRTAALCLQLNPTSAAFEFGVASFDQPQDHRGEDELHRQVHLAAGTHDRIRAGHERIMEHGE